MMKTKLGKDDDIYEEIKPCMSCFAPNPADADRCVECGAIFGGGTGLSPMSTVRSEAAFWSGVAPGQKNERRPRLIKVVVVWVILLPLLISAVVFGIEQVYLRMGFLSFVVFWLAVAISYFSVSGLYRTTRDYLKLAPETPEAEEQLP